VADLIGRSGISQTKLAEEVGLSKMSVSRYLSGASSPESATVKLLNHKAAKLVGIPEVREYLDALALLSGRLDPERQQLERAFDAARAALRAVEPYFVRPDAVRALLSVAIAKGTHDEGEIVALVIALAAMRGKHLLRKIDGRRSRELFIDEIVWLFDQAGIHLDVALRTDYEAQRHRILERFEVRAELALTALATSERLAVLGAILAAYDAAIDETDRAHSVSSLTRRVMASSSAQPRRMAKAAAK
jgi:transcriptional regulator with XRE-family HTH domain